MTDAPDILETAQKALELSAKATPGPWDRVDAPNHPGFGEFAGQVMVYANALPLCGYRGPPMTPDDCDLIAFARTAMPELANEVLRLRGEVDALREVERAARSVAALQPAAYARTQQESNKWVRFYNAIFALDSLRGGTRVGG
jgi:hypothetical protein